MRPERVELPTYGFVVRRSIQLSYGRRLGSVAQSFLASGCGTEPFEKWFKLIEVDGLEKVIVSAGIRIGTKMARGWHGEDWGKVPNETIFHMVPLARRPSGDEQHPLPLGEGAAKYRPRIRNSRWWNRSSGTCSRRRCGPSANRIQSIPEHRGPGYPPELP